LLPFLDLLAQYGLTCEFTVFADAQQVMSRLTEQQAHWARVCDTIRGRPGVFVSLVNEWKKNGIDPFRFQRPRDLIVSQGSGLGDEPPPMPGWSYREWHGRRDWPKVLFSNEDAWYVGAGYNARGALVFPAVPVVMNEDIGFAEAPSPNRRSTDPQVARVIALTAVAWGAGATFHCEDGIFSRPLGPIQRQCAAAFFKGLRA
jgi:hypothetical protein